MYAPGTKGVCAQKSNTITPPSIVPVNSINQSRGIRPNGRLCAKHAIILQSPTSLASVVPRSCGNSCSVGVTPQREIGRRPRQHSSWGRINDANLPHPRTIAESAYCIRSLTPSNQIEPERAIGDITDMARLSGIRPPVTRVAPKTRSVRMRCTRCLLAKEKGPGSSGPGRGSGGTCSSAARSGTRSQGFSSNLRQQAKARRPLGFCWRFENRSR